MAARYWVGGDGNWNDTAHWSSTDGPTGNPPQTVPGPGDTVILNANAGSGTGQGSGALITVNADIDTTSIAMGAFVGTLDLATNDHNVTLSTFSGSGSGNRRLDMGDGTWTITSTTGDPWACFTTTNFTLNANGSTLRFTGVPTVGRTLNFGGGLTYNIVEISPGSETAVPTCLGNYAYAVSFTIGTLTISSNNRCTVLACNSTMTITGNMTYQAASSSAMGALIATPIGSGSGRANIAIAGTGTLEYLYIAGINENGAGSITATNSIDGGNNNGLSITAPASAGGARIIGG